MFIQCQHCQATYKIDEQKIPAQNTFVRCAKCSTPISLNKQDQSALSKKQPLKIVDCSNCGTRYSIPLDKINDDMISVRCGKCSHVFQVSADETQPDEFDDTQDDFTDTFEPESGANQSLDDDLDLDNISIPEENEIEVDGLFDGFDDETEEEESFNAPDELFNFDDSELEDDDDGFDSEPKGPTEAYLQSVNLSDQIDEDMDDPDLGDFSSEEKSKLFLKPKTAKQSHQSAAKQLDVERDDWPDIHDETGSLEMDSELSEFVELDNLEELPDSSDYDTDNPLELQEMSGGKSPNRFVIVALLIILFALLGASGWFYFQTEPTQMSSISKVERFNKQSRLKLIEPLKGRLVINKNSGMKIFVLEGEIRNSYPQDVVISWIEVKGALFDRNKTVLFESTAYAGDIQAAGNLSGASNEELDVIRGEKSTKQNIELSTGQTVPFQILFFNVGDNIQKLQAQINRFARKQNQ